MRGVCVLAKSKRRLVVAAAVAALAGCAGQPKGVLTPVVAGAPQTDSVEMIVATMRDPTDVPGEMFSGERGLQPAFATITVSIPPPGVHAVGAVEWPKKLPPDPAKEFAVLDAELIEREAARAWFHDRVAKAPGRSTLIFVHGFNNRFEDAVFRFAQIAHDSDMQAVPVLFTWPSRGSMLAYGYDRESTNYSRDALELLLQVLARDPSVGEVSILAHSMGNWVTMEALRQMAIRNGRIAPKIRNVMMAAPDLDVDVFRAQIEQMGTPHPNFTLFVSQDDRALAVSRRVWGDVARLGAIDPETEPYKTELSNYRIQVIDLTKLKAERQHASLQVRRISGDRAAHRDAPCQRPDDQRHACRPGRADHPGDDGDDRHCGHRSRPGDRGTRSDRRPQYAGELREARRRARRPR